MKNRWPLLWLSAITLDVLACGARTSLGTATLEDASTDTLDAVAEAAAEIDSAEEGFTVNHPHGGGLFDAFPDVPIPPGCADAGVPPILVLTLANKLYAFDPPSLVFTKIGDVMCPTTQAPFSMAVSREHVAYSVFNAGDLFRIDTGDAACTATPYVPNQDFSTFGMGYSGGDDAETLFIASDAITETTLGILNTTTFTTTKVDFVNPATPRSELTGTADGRLFAFSLNPYGTGSMIEELEPSTAKVIGSAQLSAGANAEDFAFAFWGGAFWIFTSSDGETSTVTRFTLTPVPHEQTMTTFDEAIVGAGVSTCAPE